MTLRQLVELTLAEDLGPVGDITTNATVPAEAWGTGLIVARQPLVVSGLAAAVEVFRQVDPSLVVEVSTVGGAPLVRGDILMKVRGSLRSILVGERPALNFLGRLCGIASHTRTLVEAAGGRSRVVDTRKTTPLLRALEKEAVRDGGGYNHRFGLFDGVLIKDNHVIAAGGAGPAVLAARQGRVHHLLKIGVEVDSLQQIPEVLAAGAHHILLDNMSPEVLRQAVALIGGRATTEASGGVTLHNIGEIAATGVDFISSGSLIHGAVWADVSLDLEG